MSVHRGGEATFRIPAEDTISAECTGLSCELPGIVTAPSVVAATVLVGIVTLLAFAYVRDAKECCREERRRVLDERDAFMEFTERISSFEPTPVQRTTTADNGPVIGVQRTMGLPMPGDVRLRRVAETYEETVMSLPHYREEYDETVAESLAAELGPDTTVSLARGETLSPELYAALVTRGRHAADSRSKLADAIGTELDALEDAEARLAGIDRSRKRLHEHLDGIHPGSYVDAGIDVWGRLDGLEANCEEAVADRQRQLCDPPMSVDFATPGEESPTFYRYLYGPLEGTNFPVLSCFAGLADRIRHDKNHLVSRIANGTR